MNKRAAMLFAVVVVATLALSGVALAKTNKFTFEGVTLVEDEIENAVIEVASKSTKKEELTTCSYFTADYEEYLGQFQGEEFFTKDEASQAEDFCVENFSERGQ